jgi:hypothetical protein
MLSLLLCCFDSPEHPQHGALLSQGWTSTCNSKSYWPLLLPVNLTVHAASMKAGLAAVGRWTGQFVMFKSSDKTGIKIY